MSGFFKSSRVLALSLALSSVGSAALFAQGTGSGTTAGGLPPAVPPAPATMPAGDKPIATINGKDINNARFYSLLMEVAGMRVFQQVFDLTLVQNACSLAGIDLQGPNFEARMKDELNRFVDSVAGHEVKEDNERNAIVNQFLQQRGITLIEFRMSLEKNAGLRALAAGKVDVTPEDFNDAYEAKYGERAQILLFDLGTAQPLQAGAALRKEIETNKKDPIAAAQAANLPAPNQATISKSAKGPQIESLRNLVFAANRKVGDLSTIELNNHTFMVYIQKQLPSETTANPKDKVRADLTKEIQNLKENAWMNNHLAHLRATANVTINDPVLSGQFAAIADAIKRQAEAAASQPGGTAATMPAVGPAIPAPGGAAAPARGR